MSLELAIEPAGSQHESAILDLFARAGVGCHCQYWHFPGDKNDWLARLAHEPDLNRNALCASLADGSAGGLVALSGTRAVGWLKLAASERLEKLYAQRVYRALPCFEGDRTGVLTVGCLLVDEAVRRQGVARALVRACVERARTSGARAIEAFPRGSGDISSDAELWMGPLAVFLELGFRVVNDFRPYPVLRCDLPPLHV